MIVDADYFGSIFLKGDGLYIVFNMSGKFGRALGSSWRSR